MNSSPSNNIVEIPVKAVVMFIINDSIEIDK